MSSPVPTALQSGRLRNSQAATIAAALSVVGVFSILSTGLYLWSLWMNDPLKSIGGFIPIVSLVLILRAWRGLGWESRGTWWGLLLIAAIVGAVHVRDHAILELVLGPAWSIFLPPHSLVALGYVSGAVLLFGGVRLYRAALFPVLLMWFVNPVPHFFTLHVDLPLQHASAKIARGFAHIMGYPLTHDQLRLMFTPDFGMFIAPGCNGIRGAITMGFIALVAGYLYRFRLKAHIAVVAGAVMLGYVFNLVRLCVLVLYYIVALRFPWFQSRATMGDYIIGACLFLFATTMLFVLIRRWSATGDLALPPMPAPPEIAAAPAERSFVPRAIGFGVVLLLGSVGYAVSLAEARRQPVSETAGVAAFPQQIGKYKLDRTWNEHLVTGALIFYWADYIPEGGGTTISLGISPVLGAHDTLLCHAARGEDWLWHDTLTLPTANGNTDFSASFFNDGATQYLEATTVCEGDRCGQVASDRKRFGLIYSKPDTRSVLSVSPTRPIPVLLRAETTNTSMAPDLARQQMTAALSSFLRDANLSVFLAPYR